MQKCIKISFKRRSKQSRRKNTKTWCPGYLCYAKLRPPLVPLGPPSVQNRHPWPPKLAWGPPKIGPGSHFSLLLEISLIFNPWGLDFGPRVDFGIPRASILKFFLSICSKRQRHVFEYCLVCFLALASGYFSITCFLRSPFPNFSKGFLVLSDIHASLLILQKDSRHCLDR